MTNLSKGSFTTEDNYLLEEIRRLKALEAKWLGLLMDTSEELAWHFAQSSEVEKTSSFFKLHDLMFKIEAELKQKQRMAVSGTDVSRQKKRQRNKQYFDTDFGHIGLNQI